MKAVLPCSLLIVCGTAVVLAPSSATAQTRPATPQATRPSASPAARPASTSPVRRRSPVAVVDVSYIFKNHTGFKGAMESMKKQVEAYEEHLRTQQTRC